MNLVTEHWIPIVTADGQSDFASLMQIFTEGNKFVDLSVRPHERVALMRLLICIAQAALDGPADKDEWKESEKKLPDAAKKYLEKWNKKEVFELFHHKIPFLQIPNLKSKILTPLSKLDLFLATGNNATLFDHGANGVENRPFLLRELAVMLISFQCFSPGGGLPIVTWKNKKTSQVGNPDSLCITGSMYHTLIRGRSVIQSVHLNSIPRNVVKRHYGQISKNDFWGKPIWEMTPSRPNDKTNTSFPKFV